MFQFICWSHYCYFTQFSISQQFKRWKIKIQHRVNLNGSSTWVAIKIQMKYQTLPKFPHFLIFLGWKTKRSNEKMYERKKALLHWNYKQKKKLREEEVGKKNKCKLNTSRKTKKKRNKHRKEIEKHTHNLLVLMEMTPGCVLRDLNLLHVVIRLVVIRFICFLFAAAFCIFIVN